MLKLPDGARIAVVGGGPAGSLTGFFLLVMADRIGLDVTVDLYEPRDFKQPGATGYKTCAGVVAESLVQALATEGINLPPTVVQRGINTYVLHTQYQEAVSILPSTSHLRIATVYRGMDPNDSRQTMPSASFDEFLLNAARRKGVHVLEETITALSWQDTKPQVHCGQRLPTTYDLVVVAVGVNSALLASCQSWGFGYRPPQTVRGFVGEIHMGRTLIEKHLGQSMHIFLLNIPGIKFAAILPKAEYVTVVVHGPQVNMELVKQFMNTAEVKRCFPESMNLTGNDAPAQWSCHSMAQINVGPAFRPFGERIVLVGECAVARLYKNGIGTAYITAKACATTAILHGVAQRDFQRHYWPVCARIIRDNAFGVAIFLITALYQKSRILSRGMVRMVLREKNRPEKNRLMSSLLWDIFTGSASYRNILTRSLKPKFIVQIIRNIGFSR